MRLYAATIFLSAFLLFQVQPMIGKAILPWFGSSPAVWTTCMLFFQVFLLAGYAYAHFIVSRLRPNRQALLHAALLLVAVSLLPVTPSEAWKPTSGGEPTWRILALLAASVGAPYLLLSSTGPLLQGWFARRFPGHSPYRLYALSNAGSLLALLSYPVAVERWLPVQTQTISWSWGYLAFAVLSGLCAWRLQRSNATVEPDVAAVDDVVLEPAERPTARSILSWLGLSACGSVMLLAVTNQVCQDVAVVPFLWIAPLTLYLLSFVICFDNERWYKARVYAVAVLLGAAGVAYAFYEGVSLDIRWQIAIFCATLFVCCMLCHGELVRRKPSPQHLTLFYLMVSLGGALGGVSVAIIAPLVFSGFWEIHLALAACCLIAARVLANMTIGFLKKPELRTRWRALIVSIAATLLLGVGWLCGALFWHVRDLGHDVVLMRRNFYGVLTLRQDEDDLERPYVELLHGRIAHGSQFTSREQQDWPTTYYGRQSAIGLAMEHHPQRDTPARTFRVGVVGQGAGTIAAYARAGDVLRFYEINPLVVDLAESHFTFQSNARQRGADVDVFLGDARIVMERQLAGGDGQRFDVLAIDAFSGDAIPIHLLTRECFEIYWQHLRDDGVLVVHISNRYLNLVPVVRKLAEVQGKKIYWIDVDGDDKQGTSGANWVIITSNQQLLTTPAIQNARKPWRDGAREPLLWTDDFSSLIDVLK